ncbi:hypothetical protein GCM10009689_17390 [Brevibacterium antiquum]|uniref:hypothetical protein n=1 Tax=Brevibacterium antiquum TaxID=234835 RepID=UPI0018E04812|nr:hypothetical protein [Brevibacterium antiquum]
MVLIDDIHTREATSPERIANERARLDILLQEVDSTHFAFIPNLLLRHSDHGNHYAASKWVAFYLVEDGARHRVSEYSDDPRLHVCVELALSALTVSGQWFIDELMTTFFGRTHLSDDNDEEATTFLIDPFADVRPATSKLAVQLSHARARRMSTWPRPKS